MKNKLQHVKSYVRVKPKRKKESKLEKAVKEQGKQIRKGAKDMW